MIRLHHVAQSRSFRTMWLLEELGLDYEIRAWSFFDGSMRSPEFLAMSPAGRVPALEIDGRRLFESGAIAQYLCETRPQAGLAPMPGEAERAQFLEWLHFAETIGNLLANLTQHHIVLRDPAMRSETVMRLEARRLEKCLGAIEAAVAGVFAVTRIFGGGYRGGLRDDYRSAICPLGEISGGDGLFRAVVRT